MSKTFLQQWKTILGIVGLSLTSLAYIFGVIDEQTAGVIGTVIGAITGVCLKLGLNRAEIKAQAAAEAAERAVRLATGPDYLEKSGPN